MTIPTQQDQQSQLVERAHDIAWAEAVLDLEMFAAAVTDSQRSTPPWSGELVRRRLVSRMLNQLDPFGVARTLC